MNPDSEQDNLSSTSSVLDLSSEDEQQDCLKCDHALTLKAVTYMDQEQNTNIGSPSSIVSIDSDTSEQSALNTPQMPELDLAPRPLDIVNPNNTSGRTNTGTALQCKNRLHLKINLPGTQNLPNPDSNSAHYQ